MKTSLLLIALFCSSISFGQEKYQKIKLTIDSDTLFWKEIQSDKIKKFNLPELDTINEFVFRKWSPGSVLEITKNKNSFNGRIIYFVFEVWQDDYEADQFVKQYDLSNKNAESIYKFIKSSGLEKIPSDKHIKGWSQGFDGITHIYETKDKHNYSFKNYWTPTAQKDLEEAKWIIDFNKAIGEIAKLEKYSKKFVEEVPFLHYKYSGTAYYVIKDYTRKEWRKYKRKKTMAHEKNKR